MGTTACRLGCARITELDRALVRQRAEMFPELCPEVTSEGFRGGQDFAFDLRAATWVVVPFSSESDERAKCVFQPHEASADAI